MVAALHVIEKAETAQAALHPLRRHLLHALNEPASASGLARRLGLPRQLVNYHLRLLEEEGLLEAVEERQRRGCTERVLRTVAQTYLIGPAALGELAVDPERVADRASSAYLIAVAARTIQDLAVQRARAAAAGRDVPTLTLHADVRFASPETQSAFAEELTQAFATLVAKYHDDRTAGGRWFRATAGAYAAPPARTAARRAKK